MEGIFTEEEDRKIMQYASKIRAAETVDWERVFQSYKESTGSVQSVEDLTFRFRYTLLPNIQWTDLLNIEQKLKFCSRHQIYIDRDFLKYFSKHAEVSLDSRFHITDYKIKSSTIPFSSLSSSKQKFWTFLIENAQRSETEQFWEECRCAIEFSGSPETVKNKFYKHFAPKLHLLDIPVEQKLKLYKAFRLPIDKDQLEEIKKTHIIAYYAGVITDYSLINTTFTHKEKDDMWQYLLRNFRKVDEQSLWIGYHEKGHTDKSYELIRKRWLEKMAPNIHLMNFDIKTKLEIYKRYGIKINMDYLDVLEESADLEFLEGRTSIISGFTMKKKIIKQNPVIWDKESKASAGYRDSKSCERNKQSKPFSEAEDLSMWEFLFANFKKYGLNNLWSVYKKKNKAPRPVKTYLSRCIDSLFPQLPHVNYDVKDKILIYSSYKIPVPKNFLNTLRKHADLQLDKNLEIIDFAFINDSRALEDIEYCDGEEVENRSYSEQEQQEMWQFFVKNYKNYGPKQLWMVFKQQMQATRSSDSYRARCKRFMYPKVHLLDVDVTTKLDIYEKYQICVNKEYLKELRQHARIELDKTGHIINYTLIQGQLEERFDDVAIEQENYVEEPEDDANQDSDYDYEPVKKKKCIVVDSDDSDDEGAEFDPQYPVETEEIIEIPAQHVVINQIQNKNQELIGSEPKREVENDDDYGGGPVKPIDVPETPELPDSSEDVMDVDGKPPSMITYLLHLRALISHLNAPDLDAVAHRIDMALQKHSEDEAVPVAAIQTMVTVGLQLIGD